MISFEGHKSFKTSSRLLAHRTSYKGCLDAGLRLPLPQKLWILLKEIMAKYQKKLW